MGPTWGPSGTDRAQVGPMLAPWTLLSGIWTECVFLVVNCMDVNIAIERFYQSHYVCDPSQWYYMSDEVARMSDKWTVGSKAGWGLKKNQSTISLTFCKGNKLVIPGFPLQSASNAKNVSRSWLLTKHEITLIIYCQQLIQKRLILIHHPYHYLQWKESPVRWIFIILCYRNFQRFILLANIGPVISGSVLRDITWPSGQQGTTGRCHTSQSSNTPTGAPSCFTSLGQH